MTIIYDPIPLVKLVRKILVVNYESIMGICEKIFIINLHNLQMLFMLWIKSKFSECLTPHAQTWKPPMEDFLATVCPGPQTGWGIRVQLPQIFFVPPNFVAFRKICFKHMTDIKIFPP